MKENIQKCIPPLQLEKKWRCLSVSADGITVQIENGHGCLKCLADNYHVIASPAALRECDTPFGGLSHLQA